MRYYLLEADNNFVKIPRFKDFHRHIDVRDLKIGSYYKIPRRMLFRIEEEQDTLFVDTIINPVFIVSELLHKLLSKFEPNLNFKEFILLDQKYGKTETYYLPTLEEVDCLSDKSEFNLLHNELTKIIINKEKVQDKSIFTISGVEKRYVITRIDVVESMIRRNATGFTITEIETE